MELRMLSQLHWVDHVQRRNDNEMANKIVDNTTMGRSKAGRPRYMDGVLQDMRTLRLSTDG